MNLHALLSIVAILLFGYTLMVCATSVRYDNDAAVSSMLRKCVGGIIMWLVWLFAAGFLP